MSSAIELLEHLPLIADSADAKSWTFAYRDDETGEFGFMANLDAGILRSREPKGGTNSETASVKLLLRTENRGSSAAWPKGRVQNKNLAGVIEAHGAIQSRRRIAERTKLEYSRGMSQPSALNRSGRLMPAKHATHELPSLGTQMAICSRA